MKFFFGCHDRFVRILLYIVCSMVVPLNADSAESVQLSVAWNYDNNVSGVAGFRLYSTNNLVCETNNPAAREMICAVVVQSPLMPFAMTAFDAAGIESSASDPFWVDFGQASVPVDKPPAAYITASLVYGIAPLQVHFDGSKSLDPDGTIVAYAWDFSDGDQAAVISPAHTFLVPGVYAVSLVVTDDKGNTAKAESMVTVVGGQGQSAGLLPPTAVIAAQVTVDEAGSQQVNFNGSNSADVDGTVAVYRWDFGDGEAGEGAFVDHTYGEPGAYTVTLVVSDNAGLVGQTRKEIVLSGLPEQPSSVPSDNGATGVASGSGGGGCSVCQPCGEGPAGAEWLPSFIFVIGLPLVARLRKSTGRA